MRDNHPLTQFLHVLFESGVSCWRRLPLYAATVAMVSGIGTALVAPIFLIPGSAPDRVVGLAAAGLFVSVAGLAAILEVMGIRIGWNAKTTASSEQDGGHWVGRPGRSRGAVIGVELIRWTLIGITVLIVTTVVATVYLVHLRLQNQEMTSGVYTIIYATSFPLSGLIILPRSAFMLQVRLIGRHPIRRAFKVNRQIVHGRYWLVLANLLLTAMVVFVFNLLGRALVGTVSVLHSPGVMGVFLTTAVFMVVHCVPLLWGFTLLTRLYEHLARDF